MSTIPPELLFLAPLSVAAGIDLYLTLLFIGASPTIGLWPPLPGALGDLDSPGVLLMVGAMYVLEFAAERHAPTALVWNAFHAIIRPLSGALLALLLLDGQPIVIVVSGALLAALLSSIVHGVRSGGAVIRWLGAVATPSVLLVSLLEDALVVGLVALTLDLPGWATAGALLLALAFLPSAPSDLRAFTFAIRLAVARVFQPLTQRRWLWPDELPARVRASLDDDDALAPGGALRGSPVGAYRLPGVPRFVTGWLLIRGGSPLLVRRRLGSLQRVALGALDARAVVERGFFLEVDLRVNEGGSSCVFFSLNGPSVASLEAEFLAPKKNL
jgi:hypothetical protein